MRYLQPQHGAQWTEFLELSATLDREQVIILTAGDLAMSLATGDEVNDETMESTLGDFDLAIASATQALQAVAEIAALSK
jgi:hypothetical protein